MSYYGPSGGGGGDDRGGGGRGHGHGYGHGQGGNHGDYRGGGGGGAPMPGGGGMRGGGDGYSNDGGGGDRYGGGNYGGQQDSRNGQGYGTDDRNRGRDGYSRGGGGGGGGYDDYRDRESSHSRRHDDYSRDRDRDRDSRRYEDSSSSSRRHDDWDRSGGRERERGDPYSRDRYDERGGGGGRDAPRYDRGGGSGRYDDRGPPQRYGGGGGDGYREREREPARGRYDYDSRRNDMPPSSESSYSQGPPRRGGYDDRGGYPSSSHYGSGGGGGGGGGGYGSNANSRGGRDMGRMGFGSDRGRGNGGGGGGGRGGQFRGKSVPVDPNAKEANANIICASVTNNFRFYHYGIDGSSASGKLIDSRRRKAELFNFGMFDEQRGLLARNGMSSKEIEDLRRVTFFEGSFLYCSRPIPYISKFPFSLVGNKVPENNAPPSDNGDTMTFTTLSIFSAPERLLDKNKSSGPHGIVVDLRCANCTQAFKTKESLLSHCQAAGHSPQMDSDDTKPATSEQFIGFCNVALQRAMGERMARWGREYIDPKNWTEPTDRNGRQMGVRIFRAFSCEFGIHKPHGGENTLTLTVDLRAKLIRTKSLLDNLCGSADPRHKRFDRHEIMQANRQHQGEVVICTYDKKCYSVMELDFENSPASKPVEGTGMSHAEYFVQRKGIDLKYPDVPPIVAVLGRGNRKIYLPAELVCANELDPTVKQKLPMIASFTPPERHDAIEEMRKYLVPGAQKTKGVGGGLLPALGIILEDSRMKVAVEVLPLPLLKAAGIAIPKEKANMWAPVISRADYRVDRGRAVEMNVVVIHHHSLGQCAGQVYDKIRDLVNGHNAHYRFGASPYAFVEAGDDDRHWGPVEKYMSTQLPDNVFILDLVKPARRQALDAAYSVVKYILTKNGYLSQFLNFNTHDHARPRDQKASRKSVTILQGLARQILSKCGARVWWVNLPKEVPLPAVFVGVDVFHSPRKYNVAKGKKTAKESVAAVVVQVVRSHKESENTHTEIFSQTFRREVGKEMGLGNCMRDTVQNALRLFNVNPMSCVVWRDGVGDPAIKQVAGEEIPAVRDALDTKAGKPVPLSYIVVQKRISTKFLSVDGKSAIPLGSLVVGLQGPEYTTFYINGTAPPYSTPKPARFIIAETDESFDVSSKTIADLSWALCHDYSNWTGAIKLPSPVQMAHKLAELAGLMEKGGEEINHEKFAGKAHFL